MAKGDFHRIHADDRVQHNRYRIAQEAARLMSEHGSDYRRAKLKAARRLGISGDQALPRNHEIEQALREHQRLFRAHSQPQALHRRRAAACDAMRFFATFRPRLVGPVLEGTADIHSPVSLHLFCDDVETFTRFLHENNIPARQQSRRLRVSRDIQIDYPVFALTADDMPFDLTLMPLDSLRQAPLDPVHERPTPRANVTAVEALLNDF